MQERNIPETGTVRVPLSPFYENKWIKLNETSVELTLTLDDGERWAQSEITEIGTLKHMQNMPLLARISLWYKYEDGEITFCANDNDVPEAPRMSVTLANGGAFSVLRPSALDRALSEPGTGGCLASPLTQEAQAPLIEGLKRANNRVIAWAKSLSIIVCERSPFPDMDPEDYAQLNEAFMKERAAFLGGDAAARDVEMGVEIRSFYDAKAIFPANQSFANVIGSATDPHGDRMDWITLWRTKIDPTGGVTCATDHNDYGYDKDGKEIIIKRRACDSVIVGGHVVAGTTSLDPLETSPRPDIYIIPICQSHNKMSASNFMKTAAETDVIKLKQYKEKIF